MKNRFGSINIWTYITILGYVIVFVLLITPLFNILKSSFIDNETGQFSLSNYQTILGTAYYRRAITNSLIVSLGGTFGACLFGIPLAYLITRYKIWGTPLISSLAVLAMVSPPFVGAYSWIIMLGRGGAVRSFFSTIGIDLPTIYGPAGIILVFSLQFYPFIFILTSSGLSTVNRSLEEAAENLGSNSIQKFFKITLPLVIPSVSAGALIVFMLCISRFGTPMLIGGRFKVLATMAYDFYTSEVGENLGMASTMSVFLVLISCVVLFLQRYVATRRKYTSNLIKKPLIKKPKGLKKAFTLLFCWGIVSLSTLPLMIVVFFSFRKANGPVFHPGFGLQSYKRILPDLSVAVANSFIFALSAIVFVIIIGTLLGFVLARRKNVLTRGLDPLLMLPYIMPGTVMGIGFAGAFNNDPIFLLGTSMIIILAYFIRRLPYSIRSSVSVLEQIKPSMDEAAINLGATPSRAFYKVTLPMMMPGIISGAILAFVTSINELSASFVLYVGRTITMPVKIYLSVLDGDFGTGSALSTILILVTGVAVFSIYMVSRNGTDTFT
jgi:iron(III) transport system permease protein